MKVSTPVRFFLAVAALLSVMSAAVRAQDARSTLTNFPESHAILYINARRLINEAAPAVVPPEALNKAIGEAKQFIDLNGLDYVVVGARLRGAVSFTNLPEVLLIVRGNFSADGLLSAARMAGQGMYVQETYGGKTLNVFTLNKPASTDGEQSSKRFPIDQVAAVALDANTLAIGIPAYLRDAIDTSAGGDKVRLKPELVDLALRDSNTLISIVTEVPPAASQHLRALGVPPNAEADRIIDALRQIQLSVNMQPSTFGVQSIMRMDNAEAAATLSGLVNMGANFAKGEIAKEVQKKTGGDREDMTSLLRVFETLTNTTRDNEVVLGLTFQQAGLAEVIKRQMMPKKKDAAASSSAPNKGAAVKRRRPRTRRK
ncbi:MAG TPA: hypothetical protein VGO96_02465 [Pyrinomonadaceae bacterium]|jgi:hypothetical protein|nr:hypothetical protein [Pyrinomonadaceae bacterium]